MPNRKTTTTLSKPGGVVPNSFNVPARHWNKWAPQAQTLFNTSYKQVVANQAILTPPSVKDLSPRAWQVICWNLTWLTVDEANKLVKQWTY